MAAAELRSEARSGAAPAGKILFVILIIFIFLAGNGLLSPERLNSASRLREQYLPLARHPHPVAGCLSGTPSGG